MMPPSINDPDAGEYNRAEDYYEPEPDWFYCEYKLDGCQLKLDDSEVEEAHRIVKACPHCFELALKKLTKTAHTVQVARDIRERYKDAVEKDPTGLSAVLVGTLVILELGKLEALIGKVPYYND